MAILIDTSIFYALLDPDDEYHLDAVAIVYHILKGRYGRPYTIDYVLVETTLLLKARRLSYKIPLFIEFIEKEHIKTICIDDNILNESLETLAKNPTASLTDIAQLIIARKLGIKYIASLDNWFSRQGLLVLGKNYMSTLSREELSQIRKIPRKPID